MTTKQTYSRDATQQQNAVECLYKLFDCRGLALKSHNTVNMCVHHRTICEVISLRSLGRSVGWLIRSLLCTELFTKIQNRKTS